MDDVEVRIGSLRHLVTVARRRENFDPPGGVSISEDYVAVETVRAEVLPINAITFYGSEQADTPVTHRITMRWLDYLDNMHVVVRTTLRRDGTQRQEMFRVRRVKELNGRKRFSSLECELEKVSYPDGGAQPGT